MTKMRWILLVSAIIWGMAVLFVFVRINFTGEKIFSDYHNKRVRTMERAPIVDSSLKNVVMAFTDSQGRRHYPLAEAAAHIVGYVNPAVGTAGAESNFAEQLTFSVSKWFYFFQPNKKNDKPLKLSIDAELQIEADAALGRQKGAIVVLKAATGEILSMVSHPNFDPNAIDKTYKNLNEMKEGPLFNRALQGFYSPGSVWKIISLINLLDKEDKAIYCKGSMKIGDKIYKCLYPHGQVRGLKDAFARSCNLYFLQRGMEEIDKDDFLKTSKLFMSRATSGKLNNPDFMQALIGQGKEIMMTPMEGALMAATIANNGLKPLSSLVKSATAAKAERVLSPETAQSLQKYLSEVVRSGTGRALLPFQQAGYAVGIKTGTAEKEIGNHEIMNDAWIIGYAGEKKPEIAYAVVVEGTNKMAASECAPIVSRILKHYFNAKKGTDRKQPI